MVGITTVLGTFLVLSAVNLVYGLNVFALNLVIGLGLGLAIDYTLFLVTRFREELANGAEPRDAVRTTMRTAGRTSPSRPRTVAAALGTLTLFPLGFAQSMGIAGASVARRRRRRLAGRLARAARALGPQAGPQAAARRPTTAGTGSRTPSCAARA